ncbi:hypothetical protein E2C01_001087 [Portunus trituberculatus]|uniref:Uncharacterized protein n=1 Tax=Portunus trituberculatus TaxID=210409 RepID=A0A5B7CGQ8_PORTR|nr:hypothetical protein [Portunus trituberculatus]
MYRITIMRKTRRSRNNLGYGVGFWARKPSQQQRREKEALEGRRLLGGLGGPLDLHQGRGIGRFWA